MGENSETGIVWILPYYKLSSHFNALSLMPSASLLVAHPGSLKNCKHPTPCR